MLLDTRSAVETELGRGKRGRRLVRGSGEAGEEVRKRMLRWKARVEKVQRITAREDLGVSGLACFSSLGFGGEGEEKGDGERGTRAGVRKNMYWNTMGCSARAPRLLPPFDAAPDVEDSGTTCFSMRAHVR